MAKVGEIVAKHEHQLAHSVDEALAVKAGKIFAVARGGKLLCMMPLQGAFLPQAIYTHVHSYSGIHEAVVKIHRHCIL